MFDPGLPNYIQKKYHLLVRALSHDKSSEIKLDLFDSQNSNLRAYACQFIDYSGNVFVDDSSCILGLNNQKQTNHINLEELQDYGTEIKKCEGEFEEGKYYVLTFSIDKLSRLVEGNTIKVVSTDRNHQGEIIAKFSAIKIIKENLCDIKSNLAIGKFDLINDDELKKHENKKFKCRFYGLTNIYECSFYEVSNSEEMIQNTDHLKQSTLTRDLKWENNYIISIHNDEITKDYFQLGNIQIFDFETKNEVGIFNPQELLFGNLTEEKKYLFFLEPSRETFILFNGDSHEVTATEDLYDESGDKNYKCRYSGLSIYDSDATIYPIYIDAKNKSINMEDVCLPSKLLEKTLIQKNAVYRVVFNSCKYFKWKEESLASYDLITMKSNQLFAKFSHICKYSKDKQRITSPTRYVLGKPIIPKTDIKQSIDFKLLCEFSKTKRAFMGKVRKFNDNKINKNELDFSNTTYISSMEDIHPDEYLIIDTQYYFLKQETMKQDSTLIVYSNFEEKLFSFEIEDLIYGHIDGYSTEKTVAILCNKSNWSLSIL